MPSWKQGCASMSKTGIIFSFWGRHGSIWDDILSPTGFWRGVPKSSVLEENQKQNRMSKKLILLIDFWSICVNLSCFQRMLMYVCHHFGLLSMHPEGEFGGVRATCYCLLHFHPSLHIAVSLGSYFLIGCCGWCMKAYSFYRRITNGRITYS